MPMWIQAGGWGLLSGTALLIGAVLGYRVNLSSRLIAGIMAFGSGVLISAVAFELVDEAYQQGGFTATVSGLLIGAVLFSGANLFLSRRGAKHRKRSGAQQASEAEVSGSGLVLAVGALLDGVPESIVIGLSLSESGGVGIVVVVAIFLSNLPEGLSSAAGMRRSGRSQRYVLTVWGSIALISGIAAALGFLLFRDASAELVAGITALAAGAILAMLVDTMIPEAFEETHEFAGLITAFGFLAAFTLRHIS